MAKMPSWVALPSVVVIEGDELSPRQQAFLLALLADWCAAEEQVVNITRLARFSAAGACCGGRGVVCGCLVPVCACRAGSLVSASMGAGSVECCDDFLQVMCAVQ